MALSNAHKRRMLDRYAGEKYQPKKVQPQQNDNPAFNDTSSEIIDDLIDEMLDLMVTGVVVIDSLDPPNIASRPATTFSNLSVDT